MSVTSFQLEGLHLLGYSKRESEFLFLVATHSGYFTARQFKAFAQTESGSVCHSFVRKLLERKHASFHAYRAGGRVYHVFARKLYGAIERENLRTRKKHELEYVKTRLVALDFVLRHPQHRYLETESEKVAFFAAEYTVHRETLPVKRYRARKSAEVTPRYFVDRFPIFVNAGFPRPVVTFTYVDSGAVTLDGFVTHLKAYAALLQALPAFEFIYIAPTARFFQAAEAEFQRALYWRQKRSKGISLLDYFRLRKAWDSKERVASADVVLLQEAQSQYASGGITDLYEKWRQGGIGDEEVLRLIASPTGSPNGTFRTEICGSSLTVFSDPFATQSETWPETSNAQRVDEVSGLSSTQALGS